MNTRYKVGDWVITSGYTDQYDGIPLKINIVRSGTLDYQYCHFENAVSEEHNFTLNMVKRLATQEEIDNWKLEKGWFEGKLKGFPKEVVSRMLKCQVKQGGSRDLFVFEKNPTADWGDEGFTWEKSTEGHRFWRQVISCKDFNEFFKKYPKDTTPNRFPFSLSHKNQLRIINIACIEWRSKLKSKFIELGAKPFEENSVLIAEDFYKEMRNACSTYQHKLFDEIFGKDEKPRKLFIRSEDGYDLYEDDPYWFIWTTGHGLPQEGSNKPWIPYYISSISVYGTPSPKAKFFKTEEGAKKWLRDNLPMGTMVYMKNRKDTTWSLGKYKEYNHRVESPFKIYTGKECTNTSSWQIVSLTNPLTEEPILL